jgi:hypothetical protein
LKRVHRRLIGVGISGVLGCHSAAPTPDRPTHAATVEVATSATPGTRTEAVQPEAGKQFIDRLYEVALSWDHDATVEQVEAAFAVTLAADGGRLSGTSRQWPIVVTFYPKAADRAALLQLAFTDVTGVSLAEVETRFGPPAQQIEAKESLAAFASQSGARLVVSLLGGTKPSSIVSAIKLEGSGKEKLVPKDLF